MYETCEFIKRYKTLNFLVCAYIFLFQRLAMSIIILSILPGWENGNRNGYKCDIQCQKKKKKKRNWSSCRWTCDQIKISKNLTQYTGETKAVLPQLIGGTLLCWKSITLEAKNFFQKYNTIETHFQGNLLLHQFRVNKSVTVIKHH